MTISRRAALGRAATIFAAAPMAAVMRSQPAAPAAEVFGALPSKQQLWEDLLFMISCGSRNTGFPGHVKFVDFLTRRLKECPGVDVHLDSYTLSRWEATNYALSAQGSNRPMRSRHATSA